MDNNQTYYTDLISRYFLDKISGDELQMLSDWLSADTAHQDIFKEYQATWQLLTKSVLDSSVNLDDEWVALQSRIKTHNSGITIPKKRIKPEESEMNRVQGFRSFYRVAAAIIVFVASSFILYFYFTGPRDIVVTAKSGNMFVRLPDGTAVVLNLGSMITYPDKFAGDKRKIDISGEAYFNVKPDKTKPFVIASGDARVEVLGTSFNINTRSSSGKMEVVLTEGKVSVYYKDRKAEKLILAPGEKAEIETAGHRIEKSTNYWCSIIQHWEKLRIR
jgi:transmembrane sensor